MIDDRFEAYMGRLGEAMGHMDRLAPLRDYCTGLLTASERKSVEPLAALISPERVSAKHQSLLHFVGQAPWSDDAVLRATYAAVLPSLEGQGGAIEAWIVDDTGFAKKGQHSAGVARQYCGRLGKQDNCQVAVSLSVANRAGSLPVAYRLYLPQEWAEDSARRAKAGVPEDVKFQTKPQIALDQIRTAQEAGVPVGVVLADAGYGHDGAFRAGLTKLGLTYVVGIQSSVAVWPPGQEPLPPPAWNGSKRKPIRLQRRADHKPVSVKELAQSLQQEETWQEVTWREGSNAPLTSRFAALRVRPSTRDNEKTTPHPVEWLLVEWPDGEDEPSKYWLSTLPEHTPLPVLVDRAKMRWRIERDYQELKSELGLAHYEGRGWRGFHHHATLCIAAYGFLIIEKEAFSPSAPFIERKAPRLHQNYRPRGASNSP
jgi:SRSO17 transposase